MKLKEIAELNKKEKSGFKTSGILLEDWVHEQLPQLKRNPPKSKTDFAFNKVGVDVKGCHAGKHNNNIFIEAIQNVRLNSIPSHITNPNILLLYVDYDTGVCTIINWGKLYSQCKNQKLVSGGYEAKGWIVNLDSLVADGFAAKLCHLEDAQIVEG
jgi:hypothetical protein